MHPITTLTKLQKRIGFTALLLFALLYFLCSSGINCSNDGSHFALAKSMYYNQSTEIKPFFKYVMAMDYAVKDGVIYSDRLPGNAFLMLPFLAYSNSYKFITQQEFGNKFEGDVIAISLLPNLAGLATLLILFLLYRKFGFSFNLAFISTAIYGIATLHWLEATHAFSHSPSIMFVALAVYLAVSVKDIKADQKHAYWIAALIGFSTLIELQNILFFIPIFLYIIVLKRPEAFFKFKNWIPTTAICIAIGAFFVGCLVCYNYIAFGEFILKSNTYNPSFPEEKTFRSALAGNFLLGVDTLLTNFQRTVYYTDWQKGVGNDTPGLFVSSPILILSLFGMTIFLKEKRNEALLFLMLIGISITIAALHMTTLTRHISTIMPFLYFPIIYVLKLIWDSKNLKVPGLSLVFLLVAVSSLRVAYITFTYFGRFTGNIFPYSSEIFYFFAFYVPISALVFFYVKLTNKQKVNRV